MKTFITLFVCFFSFIQFTNAQYLQNADMENWKELPQEKFGPEGWITQNQVSGNYSRLLCIKSDNAYSGNHAIQMVNHLSGGGACYSSSLRLGTFDENNPDNQGIAFTERPVGMAFYYTFYGEYENTPTIQETPLIGKAKITLTRWDETLQENIIVGEGIKYFGSQDNTTTFELAEVEIEYFSDKTPEKLLMYFKNPCDGSSETEFTVDFVGLSGINTTSSDEITLLNEITAFPNPARNNVTFKSILESNDNKTIQITDIQGIKVSEITFSGNDKTIDISNWSNGIYFYHILQDGKRLKTDKIFIAN